MITKEGWKYQMDPLPNQGEDKKVGSSVMLLGGKEILRVLKLEGDQVYAIMVRPKEVVKKMDKLEVLDEVQKLLD